MMRHLVRGAALLLLLALAALSLVQQELRFVLAGVAVAGLVEVGLALRARRNGPRAPRDRLAATQVSCMEQDGALSLTLAGERRRGAAPYLLLSRRLADAAPRLELSDPRWTVEGGLQEVVLSPGLLRVSLDARAAQVLGTREVCVTLEGDIEQRPLERSLRRILRGVSFTSERSAPQEAPDAAIQRSA